MGGSAEYKLASCFSFDRRPFAQGGCRVCVPRCSTSGCWRPLLSISSFECAPPPRCLDHSDPATTLSTRRPSCTATRPVSPCYRLYGWWAGIGVGRGPFVDVSPVRCSYYAGENTTCSGNASTPSSWTEGVGIRGFPRTHTYTHLPVHTHTHISPLAAGDGFSVFQLILGTLIFVGTLG